LTDLQAGSAIGNRHEAKSAQQACVTELSQIDSLPMNEMTFHRTGMTAAEFGEHFPEITVGLNWQRFQDEAWPVQRQVLTDRDELLGFYTFFRRSLGRVMPHFLHWVASRQMAIADVLRNIDRIPAEHRQVIDHFVALWADGSGPIELKLPTYRFGQNKHFIVDGNHRACAVALSQRPFRLELYSIDGPVERDALVDVVHCR
jgi:hypothetical protein